MTSSRLAAPALATAMVCLAGCGSAKSSASSAARAGTTATPTATATTALPPATNASAPQRPRDITHTFRVRLKGADETPSGASTGTGSAVVTVNTTKQEICWVFSDLKRVAQPTLAHIHVGKKGISGNVVVPLSDAAQFALNGCVPTTRALIRAILKHPSSYYVNIHTKKYPAGAVRGQL